MELRLTAVKPSGAMASALVLYKGPFEEVADEVGTVYRRGEAVRVSARQADVLRRGPAADQFAFLPG